MAKEENPVGRVIDLEQERQRRLAKSAGSELLVVEIDRPSLDTLVYDPAKLNDRMRKLREYLPFQTSFYYDAGGREIFLREQPSSPLYSVKRWGYDSQVQLWYLVADAILTGENLFDELKVWDDCYLQNKTQPWKKDELADFLYRF